MLPSPLVNGFMIDLGKSIHAKESTGRESTFRDQGGVGNSIGTDPVVMGLKGS